MVVIMSPAPPGVVVQLDGHDATRLAMTRMGLLAFPSKRSGWVCRLVITIVYIIRAIGVILSFRLDQLRRNGSDCDIRQRQSGVAYEVLGRSFT